jgi:hypothetical protein
MEMHMLIQARAKAVDEGDGTDVQHHVQHYSITLQKKAQALWHRQHPLAHWQAGQDVVCQMRRSLRHTPRVARGAYASAFAGEGHEVVVRAVSAAGAGKAVGKDAALQILSKRLAYIGLGGAVITLPVELACAGQLKPGFVVLCYRLVQQRALRMARVVELGWRCGRHKYRVNAQYFAASRLACIAK